MYVAYSKLQQHLTNYYFFNFFFYQSHYHRSRVLLHVVAKPLYSPSDRLLQSMSPSTHHPCFSSPTS